ncbi:MAG TPA: gas vesicle protein [Desulfosporosinus sp.]|nr:gas vesicle protein [Desulfosporosinus sp.]
MSDCVKPLTPTRHKQATVNDLLARLLEKGLLLKTDLIIGVAGIPLLGLNLHLALAGMSTMLKYGMMRDWDEVTRAWESEHRRNQKEQDTLPLHQEELMQWKGFGAHWYENGIYAAWRPGMMYLTDKRLMLIRPEPYEVLFDVPYNEIISLEIERSTHFTGVEREELHILLRSGNLQKIHLADFKRVLDLIYQNTDLNRDLLLVRKSMQLEPSWFKVWFKNEVGKNSLWQSGKFCVEEGRLLWHVGRKERPLFSLWPPDLLSCKLEYANLGLGSNEKPVLELHYLGSNNAEIACFSGPEEVLSFWMNILQGLAGDNLEVCPGCGAPGSSRRLLEEGCDRCGWLSAKKQRTLKSFL